MSSVRTVVSVVTCFACSVVVGCKGGERAADTGAAAVPPAAAPGAAAPGATAAAPGAAPTTGAPAAITGKTVDVKMIGDASGSRFDPVSVTIKAGDGIRWTMVSGPPHNVAFWPDSIPAGSSAQLQAGMPDAISPLTGPMLVNPNQTYTMSFAGVKPGTYHYYCVPHLAAGMIGTIVVQ